MTVHMRAFSDDGMARMTWLMEWVAHKLLDWASR